MQKGERVMDRESQGMQRLHYIVSYSLLMAERDSGQSTGRH